MSICNFSLTMSETSLLKVLEGGKSSRDHLGSVSKFQSETSNPVAQKPNVNIYKALSILYPASFSFYAFSSLLLSSLFFDPLLPSIPFALIFLMPIISPQSVHSEEDSVMERKGLKQSCPPRQSTLEGGGW